MPSFHKVVTLTFILLFSSWIANSQYELDYHDIEAIDASCYPKDTCHKPRRLRLSFLNRSCECDNKCEKFGDCCIDAARGSATNNVDLNPDIECLGMNFTWGVYAVTKCPTDYRTDEEIRLKCEENQLDVSDPLLASPQTDISSNITYKNHYCAYCNNVPIENLRSWSLQIECDHKPSNSAIDKAYLEDHLTLVSDEDGDHWGFYYPEESSTLYGERQFYPCSIPHQLPDALRKHVRSCRPELVSSCVAGWPRPVIERKCQSYTAVVYMASRLYKNPHCILCNNLDVRRASCTIPSGIISRAKKPALSFTVLMDVNMNDGRRVGEISDNRCSGNKQWDPVARKCRNVSCAIPGSRVVNGQCVRP